MPTLENQLPMPKGPITRADPWQKPVKVSTIFPLQKAVGPWWGPVYRPDVVDRTATAAGGSRMMLAWPVSISRLLTCTGQML